jgi:uncharacterized protein (TIGR03435 family)
MGMPFPLRFSAFLLCAAALAQSPPAQFEAANIRIAAPFDGHEGNVIYSFKESGGPGSDTPRQWICQNMPLHALIAKAWDLKLYQLPNDSNLSNVRYDIAAKIPEGTNRAEFLAMIQQLLREHLGLTVHKEMVMQSVLELVIAKGGIRFKEAEPPPAQPPKSTARVEWDSDRTPHLQPGKSDEFSGSVGSVLMLVGRMQTIGDLIRQLTGPAHHVIVDKTGLTGLYDYTLKFDLGIVGAATESAEITAAPLTMALSDQLGLKLQEAKAPVERLFVDGFHKEPVEQ